MKIAVLINKRDFEYDIHSLVKAFYPDREVTVSTEATEEDADLKISVFYEDDKISAIFREGNGAPILEDQEEIDYNRDRKETKNALKKLLYRMMSQITGRGLPWGDLTGIRPTKIPMALLQEGWNKDEIREYMQHKYFVSNGKTELAIETAAREKAMLDTVDYKNGYSLYVGIPFCPSICLYCSFSSSPLHVWKNKVDDYIEALCKEIEGAKDTFKGRNLDSAYIGGGTPTTLEPYQMDRLLTKIEECFDLENCKEFTVEAGRPDSITREKLQVLRDHGISRISVNPQTMNQKTLDIIGRKHTVEEIVEVYNMAREMGFDNINMDLIVGLPGEGHAEVLHTMEELKKLNPDSITVHSLALKRATRLNLFKDQYEAISFHNSNEIMDMTAQMCASAGLRPYYLYRQKNMAGNMENVGYAKPGSECLYNVLIMEEVQSILAFGAGASTKIVYDDGRIERVENVKDIKSYIERIDEMIDRKKTIHLDPQPAEKKVHLISRDVARELSHGVTVSSLARRVAGELNLDKEQCHKVAIAGLVHDIGKLKLEDYVYDDTLTIEEMKYVRMHADLSAQILKENGYPEDIVEWVHCHHENCDGTGYPRNLRGDEIPLEAKIIRVCDVFAALTSDRIYRKAFDIDTAVDMMIGESRFYDLKVFLAFMRVVHTEGLEDILDHGDTEQELAQLLGEENKGGN